MYLPQSHGLQFLFTPQPEGITYKIQKEINESFLENTEVSAYNKAKFKVIQSLDELVDCQENNNSQEVVKETTSTQEPRNEKKIDEKVEIIDSERLNYSDDEKLTKEENYKSEKLTLLQKGKIHLSKGERAEAMACFKIAVHKDKTCLEAWKLLGIMESENLRAANAIKALARCLQLEPQNLDILMMLALVYSGRKNNKFSKYQSLVLLSSWLKCHPEYKDIIPENFEINYVDGISTKLKTVQDMFIQAARRRPTNIDYQVQSALGILFDLSNEYNKVIDCYRSALQVRPQDARLWNRLGVAFSRQGKDEEAMELYQHALSLNPSLTCCYYNIGLIHMKANAYGEAAEQFLIALNVQARFQNDLILNKYTSDDTWLKFITCLSYIDRSDLQAAALQKDLKQINKEFGLIKI